MSESSSILVVEDDPDVADTVRGLLRAFGYHVEVAIDGNEGMRALRRGLRPSVILLDLMMPNMDGQRFRALQRDDPELAQIPIIVISSDAKNAARLGVAACLPKPFDPEQLLAAIKRHC